MAVPGWPELAAAGASMARPRTTLIAELLQCQVVGGRRWPRPDMRLTLPTLPGADGTQLG